MDRQQFEVVLQAAALDPLALHRPFCPWVNSGAQVGNAQGL